MPKGKNTSRILNLFCLVDGEAPSNAFSIKIPSDGTVDDLKDLIKTKKSPRFDDVAPDELTLWRVSFLVTPSKRKESVFLDPNTAKELDPMDDIFVVFKDMIEKSVNVIVQRPPPQVHAPVAAHPSDSSRHGLPLSAPDDGVIKEIQGVFHPCDRGSYYAPQLSDLMPWQERPMGEAIDIVLENVGTCLSSQPDRQNAKAESSFLVCSGTAGIGKTRYGRELYGSLRHQLSTAAKIKGLEYSPYYHYMLLDFGNGVSLGAAEASLDAETILGMRLAYAHFFQGRYREGFPDFYYRAVKYCGLFTISAVIIAIRQDLKLPEKRQLFLFLHVDEFQRIFVHRWQGTPKGNRPAPLTDAEIRLTGDKTECRTMEGRPTTEGHTTEGLCLFREMMRSLGSFMSGAIKPDMIQTFLSGTARKEVTLAAEPTSYTFKFLKCPTLSVGACYDIMSHFTTLTGVRPCQWMPKMAFFHLLTATGGLPRALQLLLEEFFGRRQEKCNTFKDTVENIGMNADPIFMNVARKLDDFYSITAFADNHKELVRALIRLCIFQQPSSRTLAPSDIFPELTLDVLERDAHTILEESEVHGKVLVRIPFFFLHLYNSTLDEVRNHLRSAFLHDWMEDRERAIIERFIAEYEVLRTNILIGVGRETATLGEIYQGALGQPETLNRTVKLKNLSVITAAHRFPESGKLTVREQQQLQEQERDWRSGVVIKNADGAGFGDVCVYREGYDNGDNILCALQAKKLRSPLSASLLTDEHTKNMDTVEKIREDSPLGQQGIKEARTITVLVSTADMTDHALQQLNSSFPDNCLLIYRGNFTEFFGDTFGMSAALASSKDLSWNFATRETLKRKQKLGKKVVDQILKNVPYRSYDDLIQKVPAMCSKKRDTDMGFLPYQPEKRRRVE
ncbi:hypothetical protein BG006_003073 [Podila minutissima]|uniref:Crinkler effector protein N-terminal domain-containing protein n=1 Tax=Podila minutissima TaxID=64525 RepID=A0A9P5S8M0_9FUNG|nr:hypothetical protein BG006_003073 [Podila minutissima]